MPAYIAVAASNDNSLTIIDVTNPAAPVFVSNIPPSYPRPSVQTLPATGVT